MRAITKGPEPASLTAHRQTPHGDYSNYEAKDDLRYALVTEQRGLCCYCMGRIHPERASMKIEHWRCQSRYRGEQLNFRNLLGACPGGLGGGDKQPAHLRHCDTRKGDRDLKWNPVDPAHHIETRIRVRARWLDPFGSGGIRWPAQRRVESQSPCAEEQSEVPPWCRPRLVEA